MTVERIELEPIGVVVGGRSEPIDDDWAAVEYDIVLDGSPVLDIKPAMQEFLPRIQLRQPMWSRELMSGYWDRSLSAGGD